MSFASDTFTDTAGTTIPNHTMTSGGPWVSHGSYNNNGVISGANRARSSSTTLTFGYYATATPPSADYEVSADLYVASVAGQMGVMGRVATGADTMYFARYNVSTTRWELYSLVAGTPANPGNYSQALTVGQTYNLRLRMVGDQISVYIDGTLRIGPITNSAVTAAGKAGIRGTGGTGGGTDITSYHLDNFLATDLGTTGRVYKRFYGPAQLPGTATTLYTVPTGKKAVIRHIHVSNPSAGEVDLTLSIGADAAGTRLWDDYPISSDTILRHLRRKELTAGETIQAFAGTAGTLVTTISGWEEPA